VRDKLRSPGSISTLITAPPMERDSVGVGVAEEFAEAGLNSEKTTKKHVAAPIATANFKILKRIGACFATRDAAAVPLSAALEIRTPNLY
jgi:hypothetical protein